VNFATAGLTPDLTLLLDIDARLGLQRRSKGGGEWNRMDDYALAFHERVRQGYLEMARLEPQRWAVIDADRPPPAVQAALRRAAAERLGLPLPAG
jgi:dTMP kinase